LEPTYGRRDPTDIRRMYYDELKNVDPNIPYEETIRKTEINYEKRFYELYSVGEEDYESENIFK